MPEKAYLVLESGDIFEGYSFGATGEVTGETVFTTGMTGYLETLTDKSYYGQIITQTFPLIGNYGVIPEDFESDVVSAKGYIVRQWCQDPSNFRSEGNLDAFLKANDVVGLYGIDTRRLTKLLRESGTMSGRIMMSKPEGVPSDLVGFEIHNAVQSVSTKKSYVVNPDGKRKVALMDYGLKENIVRELVKRDCAVTVFPCDATADEVCAIKPDGIMLSNGPGDPRVAENAGMVENLKALCKTGIPIFGICFGNQILALAHGFTIEKLKYGHRGGNQPAKDLTTGKTYITSQNHGYAVVTESISPEIGTPWFQNVNDNTNEGVIYNYAPICSVQFHPEACGGPHDTEWLFDRFIQNMEVGK